MKLILHAGCDVNAFNAEGNTPLHLAVTFKPADSEEVLTLSEMLLLLLEIGADPKLANNLIVKHHCTAVRLTRLVEYCQRKED